MNWNKQVTNLQKSYSAGELFMSKIAEIEQHYHETLEKYHERIGGKKYSEFTSQDYELYIEKLKSELAYREISEDEYKFNRFIKPVLLERIARAHGEQKAKRFLEQKMVKA